MMKKHLISLIAQKKKKNPSFKEGFPASGKSIEIEPAQD